MTDWTRSERARRTVEYTVPAREPWGGSHTQLQQALTRARDEYRQAKGTWPADDAISVHVTDEAVVISFILTEVTGEVVKGGS